MIRIAIDGACRRNGKPDCVSSGGVFITTIDGESGTIVDTLSLTVSEERSTNQRGEMLALLTALEWVKDMDSDEIQIITDSEYLFNAMSKNWYRSWMIYDWRTSSGSLVKNSDIWERIVAALEECRHHEIIMYHIKGHCIPFGKVTANGLLLLDETGSKLYEQVEKKYDANVTTKADALNNAQELSYKNNGFVLPDDILKAFVVSNVVADAIATMAVEEADLRYKTGP